MNIFLKKLADAINELNDIVPGYGNFHHGIGPYPENSIIDKAVEVIHEYNNEEIFVRPNLNIRNNLGLENYLNWNDNRAIPDLILGNKIIEFKLCRPLRNNGELEGTWMTKIFDPIKNSGSAMADVLKMKQFRQNQDNNNKWELWVVIIGFEKHNENEYSLDMFFPNLFQYTSQNYLNVSHEEFINVTKEMSNRHQFHQTLKLYAFRY